MRELLEEAGFGIRPSQVAATRKESFASEEALRVPATFERIKRSSVTKKMRK